MKISIIGSGNVARALAKRIFESGHEISAIFGRDYSKASELARTVQSKAVEMLTKLPEDSDVYILAVKDDAIVEVARAIESKKGIIAHTSGATPLNIFEGIQQNFGVFYPLQTFSAEIEADFNELPICISANNSENESKLKELAASICPNVYAISEAQRKGLHVAAVFANNFSNFLFTTAFDICQKASLDFEMLKPLIRQTLRKIELNDPDKIQTGPARRGDQSTIKLHEEWIAAHSPEFSQLYMVLTNAIIDKYSKNS
jgi:predicted short-subunit dehydrogenase-like oxidoreductase (DUF2520 family)